MDSDQRDNVVLLFESSLSILKALTRAEKSRIDDVEIVLVDIVNGKHKYDRAYGFSELLDALERGSKPVGLLLLNWDDPELMQMREFPNITSEEAQALTHAFAEAQDLAKEQLNDDD